MVKNDTRDLLNTVLFVAWRHKYRILLTFLLVMVMTAGAVVVWPPTFTATARLLVKEGRDRITLGSTEDRDSSFRTKEEVINSEAEILRSRYLHTKVIEKLGPDVFKIQPTPPRTLFARIRSAAVRGLGDGLESVRRQLIAVGLIDPLPPFQEAVATFEKGLLVSPVRKADVIEVSLSSHNPQAAAQVLNMLVSLYLERHNELRQTAGAFQFFQEQAAVLSRQLRESENRLYEYRNLKGLVSIDDQRRLLLNHIAESTTGIDRTRREIAEVSARIRRTRADLGARSESVKVAEVRQRNPALDSLEARLVELQVQREKLTARFSTDSRLVQDLDREIDRVRELLVRTNADLVGSVTSGQNLTYIELEKTLLGDEARLSALRAGEAAWERDLREYRDQLERLAAEELELNRLTRDFAEKQSDYQVYRKGLEERRIEAQMDRERIANVSIIEPATVPVSPTRPKKLMALAVAAVTGLVLGCGLAVLTQLYDPTFWREEDLQSAFEVPVIGSIGKMSSKRP